MTTLGHIFDNMSNYLGQFPGVGALIGLSTAAIGAALHGVEPEIPIVVMQLFQILAWSTASAVSIITLIGWVKAKIKHDKKITK